MANKDEEAKIGAIVGGIFGVILGFSGSLFGLGLHMQIMSKVGYDISPLQEFITREFAVGQFGAPSWALCVGVSAAYFGQAQGKRRGGIKGGVVGGITGALLPISFAMIWVIWTF